MCGRPNNPETVIAVVMAAGLGSRMGQPKAQLPWPDGGNLMGLAIRRARVWSGAVAAVVPPQLADQVPKWALAVVNAQPELGLSASFRVAFEALSDAKWTAAAFVLVDQPFVNVEDGRRMMAQWVDRGLATRASRPFYDGVPGHPVVVSRDLWAELLPELHGDHGLGPLLDGRRDLQIVAVAVGDRPNPALDIDDEDDYLAALTRV
jgi:molybdenum cofactor cytidylyltransferase